MIDLVESHWSMVKCMLRYLNDPINHGLILAPTKYVQILSLRAYSDSNYASDLNDRQSTSGSYVYFGPNLIT